MGKSFSDSIGVSWCLVLVIYFWDQVTSYISLHIESWGRHHFNPYCPVHFRKFIKIKINLNFIFILFRFYLVPQKVLWMPLQNLLRLHKEVWKSKFKLIFSLCLGSAQEGLMYLLWNFIKIFCVVFMCFVDFCLYRQI